jgi:hypothetical protein
MNKTNETTTGAGPTPGPWVAKAHDLGGEVPSWKVYNMPEGQQIASVHRWNGEGDKANAALIAAAPTMYEALKAIVNGGNIDHGTYWVVDIADINAARAAIRAAEGGAE